MAFSALGRIYAAAATGTPARLTTTASPREFMPGWSPDGQWVAFVSWTVQGGHLWKVSSQGGTPIRLSEAPGFWADPVWTPDGQRVVALRAPVMSGRTSPGPVPPDAQIVSVPAAGGASTTIAPAAGARYPHLAADPLRVYVSAPDGLVSCALRGGGRLFARDPAEACRPVGPPPMAARLSPDGRIRGEKKAERI